MDQNAKTPVTTQAPTPSPAPAKTAKERKAEYEAGLKLRKKDAKVRVLQFLKDNADKLGTIGEDVKLLIGARGPSAVRAVGVVKSVNADLRAAFQADFAGTKTGIDELTIFKTFHVGRPEMVNKMRYLVLAAKPEDRVYVEFDAEAEKYIVRGVGATPPTGFRGWLPEAKVL